MELKNKSKREFKDISSEKFRRYEWRDGITDDLFFDEPQYLSVSDSGHYILDKSGVSHFIPYGWKHLVWKAKDGESHFVA